MLRRSISRRRRPCERKSYARIPPQMTAGLSPSRSWPPHCRATSAILPQIVPDPAAKQDFFYSARRWKFVEEGSMRSLTAGLARQAMVAATMGVLLIPALMASPNSDRRVPTVANIDKPIPTRAIVIADAPPAPTLLSVKPAANAKPAAPKPLVAARVRSAIAPAPRPRPTDSAPQVVAAAFVAPAPEAERPFDLRKQLFAPVGFVRDNVARLMSGL